MRLTEYGLTVNGTFASSSDRNEKEDFAPVDSRDVLQRVTAMPIQTWHFTNDASATRHIGPMAQDFYAAFSVGQDDKHIATVDADGVALAAIQGLHQIVKAQETTLAAKDRQIESLAQRLAALEKTVQAIAGQQPGGNR